MVRLTSKSSFRQQCGRWPRWKQGSQLEDLLEMRSDKGLQGCKAPGIEDDKIREPSGII